MAEEAEVQIGIPASLGLSQEQITQLTERFQSQLVESLQGRQQEGAISARPAAVSKTVQIKASAQLVVDPGPLAEYRRLS